jgi:hypothetical protein
MTRPTSSRHARIGALAALALAAALAGACAKHSRPEMVLGPPETFDWVSQPIEFSPPPPKWERQGYNEGGQLGVFFTHRGSVGERMFVAVYRRLAERNPRDSVNALLERFDSLDPDAFRRAIGDARATTDNPLSEDEARMARIVNEDLDRAAAAYFAGRPDEARWAIESALRAAEAYEPDPEALLERIRFRREDRQQPERYGAVSESLITVDGRQALMLDYGFRGDSDSLECREVYVIVSGAPFHASYMGLEKNRPLFDRVVASIRFPERRAP